MAKAKANAIFLTPRPWPERARPRPKPRPRPRFIWGILEDPWGQDLASRTPSPVPIPLFLQPHYKTSSSLLTCIHN